MIPKGQCLIMYPYSNIIIMQNMDVYEMINVFESLQVIKQPLKADINWKEWYGDNGKNNWYNKTLPVVRYEGKLIWDY